MKKISEIRFWYIRMLFFTLIVGTCFNSCEKSSDLNVGIVWMDDHYYESDAKTFLGVIEGKFDQDTGFDATLVEFAHITPGYDETHSFTFLSKGENNFTAFVFIDINNNEQYDEGYDIISGYKHNCSIDGECLNISVSSFY